MTPVRGIVFDFNGTLSDDEPILCEIFRELFAEHGRPLSAQEYYDELAGLSDPEIVLTWLGRDQPNVDEIVTEGPPTPAEIVAIRARAADAAVVVIGTIAAAPGSPQAALVEALIGTERPLVTVALRTPWDLASYPAATTHICTYSILPDAMEALARALFGPSVRDAFPGQLPVLATWAAPVGAAT